VVFIVYYRNLDDGILAQADSIDGSISHSEMAGSAQTPRLRKHFPETWLWELLDAGYDYTLSAGADINNYSSIRLLT
jgi:hypothetical protein